MSDKTEYARLLGLKGNLSIQFVQSHALEGNALRDSANRPVITYTPLGYDAEGSQRYPVLYCLHGYSGCAASLLNVAAWNLNVFQRVDHLIAHGLMPPVLLVVIDGWTRLGGSQYVDSVHNGRYASYVIHDILPHVDSSFRTIDRAGGRAIFGKSSGGFGALHLVMEHPGLFSAVGSHSGDSYFRYNHPPSFVHAHRTLERFNWDIEAFVESFEKMYKPSGAEFATMELLGYSAAYSPRSERAFDIELPFDHVTGAVDELIFARWLAFDPVERVNARHSELKSLRARFIDCGRRDEYGLDIGARILTQRLREFGCEVIHEEFDDDHRNLGYRYDVSLPLLASVLDH